MGYFRDRIALLDKGSQEFLTVLVALGGYCTVSQAEALKIVKSTRARARLRTLERLGFLRRVAAYPVVYQVTKSTTRLLQRDSSNRRRHRLATVQARLLGVDFYLEACGWPAEFVLDHERKIATFTDAGCPLNALPQRGGKPICRSSSCSGCRTVASEWPWWISPTPEPFRNSGNSFGSSNRRCGRYAENWNS